ncbi:C2 domain-containing protein [Caenorhabditis elegans]|uniref:C2 domain-containing protein n=1 Tax=Caenorhabditis elegans TaxID=6239 RepID=E9P851_CAEEL|nr:C2 domain-containing protein [Caenorhabditis elegans]CCD68502.2 C2 domain-containing protein [Caenorhabditis elegans]
MPCLQLIRRRKKKKKKEQLVQIVEKGENEDERIMMKGGKNEEDHENEEDDDNVESSLIGCSPLTRRRRKSAAVGTSTSEKNHQNHNHPSPRKSPGFRFRRIFDTFTFTKSLKPQYSLENNNDEEESDETQKCAETAELDVVTLLMEVRLKNGEDLPVKDASGSSDPYVKFRYKDNIVYKSGTIFKNLNPSWDEEFQMIVDDVTCPIRLEVFDFDRFCTDDFMGAAEVDMSQVKWCTPTEFHVELTDEVNQPTGRVSVCVTITPMTQLEVQQFHQKATKGILSTSEKKKEQRPNNTQEWDKIVNIVLVEGKGIRIDERIPDAFCKFKLGQEKYKTKVCTGIEPKWVEQFDLHVFDSADQMLQMACIDRNTNAIIGRLSIDLSSFSHDETVQHWYHLENAPDDAQVLLLITVSGSHGAGETIETDEFNYNDIRNTRIQKYDVTNSFSDLADVGTLTVKLFGAEDLVAKDFGGKSDPFAVLELVNTRVQTNTIYKTLSPSWNKIYTFAVKDIHTCLQVTIYDEDPNNRFEFLGRVQIPLKSIRNCQKRWYGLKDEKLRKRVKGEVLLEMDVIWNPIRAAIRTFKPKEIKYMSQEQKFKASLFKTYFGELKEVVNVLASYKNQMEYLLSWHSKPKSLTAYVIFMLFVYYFQIYFIPLMILALFGYNFILSKTSGDISDSPSRHSLKGQKSEEEDEKTGTGIRDAISSVQEILLSVQSYLHFATQLLQKIKNTFNFTDIWLSTLAVIVLSLAFVLLYFVPLRWIILVWGTNKFSKKLRNPNFVDNNELLDFLSRVPSRTERQEQSNGRVNKPINL